MMKRYLIFAGSGLLALGSVAVLSNNNRDFSPLIAGDEVYTLTIDATDVESKEGNFFIKTSLHNDIQVGVSGIAIDGSNFVLTSGDIHNIDGFQAINSISVNFTGGTLNLDYGFMDNTYVSVDNTLTTGVAIDVSSILPTHFKIKGSATISSITATYQCDDSISGVRTPLANEWHMVGEGSFLGAHDGEWAPGAGPKLTKNTGSANEEWMLVDIKLTAGDVFKIAKGVDWDCATTYASWKIKTGNSSAFDLNKLTADKNTGNITVNTTGYYSFYVGINKTTGKPADYDGNNAGSWASYLGNKYVYCKAPYWWWKQEAASGIYYWGGSASTSWPGVRMTIVSQGTLDTHYSIYSFIIDTNTMPNFLFSRINKTGDVKDWGAKTKDLSVNTMGSNNMFTISKTEAWDGNKADGSWSVYNG